jgi:hypothetical protein
LTPPIQIEIVPSYRLTCLAVLFHLGALVAVIAGLPTGPGIYLCFAVLMSLSGTLVIVRLKNGKALVSLTIDAKGKVRWVSRAGQEGLATVGKGSYLSSSLVVLRLLPLDATLAKATILLLAADSAPAESLARLRVWLKWRPAEPSLDTHAED